jgi:3-oxoacyl-[acyl-carrier-protein] synthase III
MAEQPWMLVETADESPIAPFSSRIEAIGRALPETHVTTAEVMASTRHRTHIDLERLTGIRERRVASEGQDSRTLAVEAARSCLAHSEMQPDDLDVLLVCSITKYEDGLSQRMEPPLSLAVKEAIGATRATTFDISNACAGMLTGVFILNNWIRRGTIERAMVVSGEFITSLSRNAADHVHNILSRELASLKLGDAGAACTLERAPEATPGITAAGFTTISEHSRLCLAYPSKTEPGARMWTDSRAIHRVALEDTPPLMSEVLDAVGLGLDEIDWVIPHQTSARAIRKGMPAMARRIGGEPRHPAVVTVDHFGNTASTSHFVALYELLEERRLQKGERVLLLALASGLEIGVVLFTVDDMVDRYGHDA